MKTIVVPVDFSEGTDKIVQQAALLAKAFSSSIYLIHVEIPNEDSSGKEPEPMGSELYAEAESLNQLAQKVRNEGIETHGILIEGLVASSIIEETKKLEADIVVMGTHGHGVIASVLVGSISQEVIKKSGCPILLVPTKAQQK